MEAIKLPLDNVMRKQSDRPSDWICLSNVTMFCDDDGVNRGVPDLVVTDDIVAPYLVVEVAFSQSQTAVTAKAKSWMAHSNNIGVIIISITEDPTFANPTKLCSSLDRMSPDEWRTRYRDAKADNQWGPIIVDGRRWLGKLSCSAQVLAKYSSGCGPTVCNLFN